MTDYSKPSKSFFLGVAGGSGSGKTYFEREIQKMLGPELCEIIYQDNFYFDQSQNFDKDGGAVNFDHPSSIEFSLLAKHLRQLKQGIETEIPTYDFVTHSRPFQTVLIRPKPVIIVDGILIGHVDEVRTLFDELIFFDTPEELRFKRRLERDVKERGRDAEGVRAQFFKQVKPMHDQFVEPSKIHAHTVVKDLGEFDFVLQSYCSRFLSLTKN
ncbi:MAG: uridine kinase [Bdellovibrionales bacterium RIFCSPHIGHO2_02_FULL_40_15]|nr:MAG: uridine kinase [Bdellovibrionales bacterium RIFCSPHIGHO2_02_FULL_40_15]